MYTLEQRSLLGQIGIRSRWGHDPDEIDNLRRDLRVSLLADHIREVVSSTPSPMPGQLERLKALLDGAE